MLKTIGSIESTANSKENKGKYSGNNVDGNSMVDGGEVINQISPTKGKNQAKTTKFKILIKSKNCDFPPNFRNMEAGPGFFTSKARLAFYHLKQAFVKTLILHNFDLECYFRIETDAFGYAISRILSQLILDNLSR